MEDELFGIEIADFPEDAACRGVEQNPFLIELEKIGALPHFTGADGIGVFLAGPLALGEWVEIFPVAEIFGFVEEDAAAFLELAAGDAAVPGAGVGFAGCGGWDFEEEGIAEAGEIWILRRLDDGLVELLPG